LWKKDEGCYH